MIRANKIFNAMLKYKNMNIFEKEKQHMSEKTQTFSLIVNYEMQGLFNNFIPIRSFRTVHLSDVICHQQEFPLSRLLHSNRTKLHFS